MMETYEQAERRARARRRNLLIILVGLGALLVFTYVGSNLEDWLPQKPTAATQIAQIGPYQVTLLVAPNPPQTTDAANLTIELARTDTSQLVKNATMIVENDMETMDMGTGRDQARLQANGSYLAHLPFTMGGPWQVRVLITVPGAQPFTATFEVTAQ